MLVRMRLRTAPARAAAALHPSSAQCSLHNTVGDKVLSVQAVPADCDGPALLAALPAGVAHRLGDAGAGQEQQLAHPLLRQYRVRVISTRSYHLTTKHFEHTCEARLVLLEYEAVSGPRRAGRGGGRGGDAGWGAGRAALGAFQPQPFA